MSVKPARISTINAERAHLTLGGSLMDCPRLYQFYERRVFDRVRQYLCENQKMYSNLLETSVSHYLVDQMKTRDPKLKEIAAAMLKKAASRLRSPADLKEYRMKRIFLRRVRHAIDTFARFHNKDIMLTVHDGDAGHLYAEIYGYRSGRTISKNEPLNVQAYVHAPFFFDSIMRRQYFLGDRLILGLFKKKPGQYSTLLLNANFKTSRLLLKQADYDSISQNPVGRNPFILDTLP